MLMTFSANGKYYLQADRVFILSPVFSKPIHVEVQYRTNNSPHLVQWQKYTESEPEQKHEDKLE